MTSAGNYNIYLFPFSQRLEVRAQVAQAFLAKFQLSNEEMATLRGARDTPITEVISIITCANEFNRNRPAGSHTTQGRRIRYSLLPLAASSR